MVNTHQCQHLCDYVAKLPTMMTNLEDQVKDLPNLTFVYKKLLGILKTAKLLVDGCRICKWSPETIVLVHCEEFFLEVFKELHLWMERIRTVQIWKVKYCDGVYEPLNSYALPSYVTEMAKEIVALNEAAIKDHKLNIDMLNNLKVSGLELVELNVVSYLRKIVSKVVVVHKSWRPLSFEKDIILDLTEDLLGVSSTGWVIKIKWVGGYYTLKRVNDAKQFAMQAPILASLWHPHIVQLINYWEEKGKLFMLMEYMGSGDLANSIAIKQTLKLSVVIDMLIQAARAMYYLHNQGIAHYGFKCASILMTCDPNRKGYYIVKLGGFGSARRVSSNPIAFAEDVYNFGSICNESITQLICNEYWSREIHDSTIQSLRLCTKMCQREDPLQWASCTMILRLLSLAQLQSMGIVIHTNEFYCFCRKKILAPEGSIEEPLKELLKLTMLELNKDPLEEPIKDTLQELMKNASQGSIKDDFQEPIKDVVFQEPIRNRLEEGIKDDLQEPIKYVGQRPIKDALQVSIQDIRQEPIK